MKVLSPKHCIRCGRAAMREMSVCRRCHKARSHANAVALVKLCGSFKEAKRVCATLLACLFLSGCVTVTYTSPEGHTFTVTRQFSDTAIGNLKVIRPDGTEVIIEGYQSDEKATEVVAGALQLLLRAGVTP